MLRSLLQPATDLGVALQGIVLAIGIGVAFRLTWRRREWRLVTIGAALVLVGLFGLRAAH